MKERFKVRVNARDAKSAFEKVAAKYDKKEFSEVKETIENQIDHFKAKLKRVKENPTIYADKIKEFETMLARIEENRGKMSPAEEVAEAMLDHGSDARIDNKERCGVIEVSSGTYIVFGFKI